MGERASAGAKGREGIKGRGGYAEGRQSLGVGTRSSWRACRRGVWVEARGGFKAAALASASASWEVGSGSELCGMGGRIRPRFAPGLKSRVRPAGVVFKEMISRVLDSLAGNPLSRAFARVRKKGNVRCRSLKAARAFALLAA